MGWRTLHNEDLPDLHFLPNVIRMIKSGGYDGPIMWHVWGWGAMHTGLWWGDKKRQRVRPRCVGEDNIKTDLNGIIWEGVDWIHLGSG